MRKDWFLLFSIKHIYELWRCCAIIKKALCQALAPSILFIINIKKSEQMSRNLSFFPRKTSMNYVILFLERSKKNRRLNMILEVILKYVVVLDILQGVTERFWKVRSLIKLSKLKSAFSIFFKIPWHFSHDPDFFSCLYPKFWSPSSITRGVRKLELHSGGY